MAGTASDYHRGDMEITEQAATFHGFIVMTKWGSLMIAVGVLFLALFLCAHVGFFQAAGAAFVVAVAGVLLLRSKPAAGH